MQVGVATCMGDMCQMLSPYIGKPHAPAFAWINSSWRSKETPGDQEAYGKVKGNIFHFPKLKYLLSFMFLENILDRLHIQIWKILK